MNIKEHKKHIIQMIIQDLLSGNILAEDKCEMDDIEYEKRCRAEHKLADELARRYCIDV